MNATNRTAAVAAADDEPSRFTEGAARVALPQRLAALNELGATQLDTSKNSPAANAACLFGRLDSSLFSVRFRSVRHEESRW